MAPRHAPCMLGCAHSPAVPACLCTSRMAGIPGDQMWWGEAGETAAPRIQSTDMRTRCMAQRCVCAARVCASPSPPWALVSHRRGPCYFCDLDVVLTGAPRPLCARFPPQRSLLLL